MINRNIYRWELKRHRSSFLVWCISIGGLIVLGMAFFPIMVQEAVIQNMSAFFETGIMKSLMAAFGATMESLTNVLGFYCTRNAMFVQILGSFFSIMLASKILAQEEHEKSAEFLLSKPVTRIEILSSKLAAYFTYLLMLNGAIVLIGFISLELFKGESQYRLSSFLVHSLYSFLLMLTFGAIGLFLSLLIKRGRPTTNISIGIVMGGYFFDFLSKITPAADKLGYLSPFKFVDSSVMRPDYGLDWWRVLYFVGVTFVLTVAAFWIYKKKDILV
ncbi:MAG: ABC transporter permease subunit [Candidatus Aminicenantes bacterium]|nr:ABC transporter permease subunit [Candidatus Aminicenantes bacterium]